MDSRGEREGKKPKVEGLRDGAGVAREAAQSAVGAEDDAGASAKEDDRAGGGGWTVFECDGVGKSCARGNRGALASEPAGWLRESGSRLHEAQRDGSRHRTFTEEKWVALAVQPYRVGVASYGTVLHDRSVVAP